MIEPEIYCSTFCNRGHIVATGEPVDHECVILDPEALRAEIRGDFDEAIRILYKKRGVDRRRLRRP